METLKITLVVVLCAVVTMIVSFAMRPAPCTHDSSLDPGPDLITLADFNLYKQAVRKVQAAQQENNEASLLAIQVMQAGIVENRKSVIDTRDYIKQTADSMVGILTILKKVLEDEKR